MTTLFITDAWGRHGSLAPFLELLGSEPYTLHCLDPYAGQPFVFDDDAQARDYFTCRCNLDGYRRLIADKLENGQFNRVVAVGVGADALASLLSDPLTDKLDQIILIDPAAPDALPQALPDGPKLVAFCAGEGENSANRHYVARQGGFFNPRSPYFDKKSMNAVKSWLLGT